MRLFDLEITEQPSGATALIRGEIDMSTVDELHGRLKPTLEKSPDRLVLDLTGVTFLDSSGLRLVMRIDAELKGDGRGLVVITGSPRVARVFELTGAAEQLDIRES
jgi:anti-sigma B factor antagonist